MKIAKEWFDTLSDTLVKIVFTLCMLLAVHTLSAQENDSVNLPRVVQQSANNTLTLHASTGRASGTEIAYMPKWKAFGWFRADGKVEWEVVVSKAGKYEVFLEWSVSDAESGKGFVLETNRSHLKGYVAKSGSWETFKKESIGYITLKAGKQHIVFKPAEDFGNGALLDLREILIVPKGSPPRGKQ